MYLGPQFPRKVGGFALPLVPAGLVPPDAVVFADPADAYISTTPAAVATVTITTITDAPVLIWWGSCPDAQTGGAGLNRYYCDLQRGGATVARASMRPINTWNRPGGNLCWVDSPGPGTHTYSIVLWADYSKQVMFRHGALTAIGLEHGSLAMPVTSTSIPYGDAATSIAATWTTLATLSHRLAVDCPVLFAVQGPLLNGGPSVDVRIQRDGTTIWEETIHDGSNGTPAERTLSMLWVAASETKGRHVYTLDAKSSNATLWTWIRSRMFAAIELRAGRNPLVVEVADVAPAVAAVADVYASPYADVAHVHHTGVPALAIGLATGTCYVSHTGAISVVGGRASASAPISVYAQIVQQFEYATSRNSLAASVYPNHGRPNPDWAMGAQRIYASSSYAAYVNGQRQAALVIFDAPGDVPALATRIADWTATNVTVTEQADGKSHRITCTASTGEHKAVSPASVNASTTAPTTVTADLQAWAGVIDGARIGCAACYVDITLATGAVLGSSGASGISVVSNGAGGWLVSFVAAIAGDPVLTAQALDGGATSFAATTADYLQVRFTLPHGITQ